MTTKANTSRIPSGLSFFLASLLIMAGLILSPQSALATPLIDTFKSGSIVDVNDPPTNTPLPDGFVNEGDEIQYTIRVTNISDANEDLFNVTVTDDKLLPLPTAVVPVTCGPLTSDGNLFTNGTGTLNAGDPILDLVDGIVIGESVLCTGTYTTTALDHTFNSVVNDATADAIADPTPLNHSSGDEVPVTDTDSFTSFLKTLPSKAMTMCMEEVVEAIDGSNAVPLNCTANDVRLAGVTELIILDDGCAFAGDTITFRADYEVELTATARHDIGVYFSTDGDPNGDGALTGELDGSMVPLDNGCTIATLPYAPNPPPVFPFVDLDGTIDPLPEDDPGFQNNKPPNPDMLQDLCGDIDSTTVANDPLMSGRQIVFLENQVLTVTCIDLDGDGQLNLPNCTSWRVPGDNRLCTEVEDAHPSNKSKCRCDRGFNIPIPVPPSKLTVIKNLDPTTDSGLFNLRILESDGTTLRIEATDQTHLGMVMTEDALTDPNGRLAGTSLFVEETAGTNTNLGFYDSSINCVLKTDGGDVFLVSQDPGTGPLEVTFPDLGGTIECTVTNTLIADPSIDIEKSGVWNDDGSVGGSAEAGETITYTYLVTNTGNVDLTNLSVEDAFELPGTDGQLSAITCAPTAQGGTLAPLAVTTCTATYTLSQDDIDEPGTHTGQFELAAVPNMSVDNTATAEGTWAPGMNVSETNNESVELPNVASLTITKDVKLPLPWNGTTTFPQVGDVLTYDYVVTNDGPLTMTAVTVDDTWFAPNANNAPADADIACVLDAGNTGASVDTVAGDNVIDTLSPGDKANCSVVFTLDQGDLDEDLNGGTMDVFNAVEDTNMSVDNRVTVNGLDPKGVALDPAPFSTESVGLPNTGSIVLDKSIDPTVGNDLIDDADGTGTVTEGDTLQYHFDFNNDGNLTLSNVELTDPLPGLSVITCGNIMPVDGVQFLNDGTESLAPGDSVSCTATYVVTEADALAGNIHNEATAAGKDPKGNDVDDSDTEDVPVVIPPKVLVTNSLLCEFDMDEDDTNGRQFRLRFNPDGLHQQIDATNPGQFFFNTLVAGTPGEETSVKFIIPWPFVTNGNKSVHVYDGGNTTFTDEFGCILPGTELAAIGEVIVLDGYTSLPAPGDTGYAGGVSADFQEVTIDVTIPASGEAYVNIHLDYGLKDKEADVNVNGDADRYDPRFNDDALSSETGNIVIPEGAVHPFGLEYPVGELAFDSIRNDNIFKQSPGVGGIVKVGCPIPCNVQPSATVALYDSDDTLIGMDVTDADGWYNIVYKHKKDDPASYTARVWLGAVGNIGTEDGSQTFQLSKKEKKMVNFDLP